MQRYSRLFNISENVVSFVRGKYEICGGLVYLEDVYVGGEESVSEEKGYSEGVGGK
jgi:hypothetical protein